MNSEALVKRIAKIFSDKKGQDIVAMRVSDLTIIGDYFVMVSGGSNTQVKALADEVEEQLAGEGIRPRRIEGAASSLWILMDYRDVIVHVFYKETREFYQIERLWADAPRLDLSDIVGE